MSIHKRTIIRNAVKTKLSGQTAAGTNIFSNRETPFAQRELPAIVVYTGSETSVLFNTGPARLRRSLKLLCDVAIELNVGLDDALDSIAADVERLLQGQDRLGGNVNFCFLSATDLQTEGSGEKQIGILSLTFDVDYFTGAPEPGDITSADDFNRIGDVTVSSPTGPSFPADADLES